MTRAQTDDVGSQAVVDCLSQLAAKDAIPPAPARNCRLNARYKREWCTYFSKLGSEKSVQACIRSPKESPESVRNGF